MKLKTEMQDGCVHALGCCIDEDDVMPTVAKHLQHDAAYAHALVRAIKTHCHEVFCDRIEETADEQMAEWGYREE